MSALNRNQNGPQWVYVTIALLVFVTNMFSNQPREMTTTVSRGRIVTLPIADGEILCQVCKTALEQPRRVA